MEKQEQQAQQDQKSQSVAPDRNQGGQQGIQRGQGASAPIERGGGYGASRFSTSPFSLMRRFSEDMDRLFDSFFGSSPTRWGSWPGDIAATGLWPEIEVHHAGDKLVIQADVPGLKKDDVTVEVRDHELSISGERRSQSEQNEGRYYRTERSYGRFSRTVPLPEGAKADTASATFENGVLKIEMEAPGGGQRQARRIEVREGNAH
jgi:HSP20 family protein